MVEMESLIDHSLLTFQRGCARGPVQGCVDYLVKGRNETCRAPRWFSGYEGHQNFEQGQV
jgi:hypothetical protein